MGTRILATDEVVGHLEYNLLVVYDMQDEMNSRDEVSPIDLL